MSWIGSVALELTYKDSQGKLANELIYRDSEVDLEILEAGHSVNTSDLMRRMIKEDLLKFDGRPLFPERKAYTVEYELSDGEADLYRRVTEYVREEFNRAEQLANDGRKGTVGFALTVLQRRLASSPEAIYQFIGMRDPVLTRYERMSFEKDLISLPGKPVAEFVCPGHPLLDATLDLILERHRDLLKQGAILIDDNDCGEDVRALVFLEHSIQDARTDRMGNRRIVSRQIQFAEVTEAVEIRGAGYAPYLDYRPPGESESNLINGMEQPQWLRDEIEKVALGHAVQVLVPNHLGEVKSRKEKLVDKTIAAVKERLTVEINHWDHRAEQLKQQELAGRVNAKINSSKARRRADELAMRLRKRMEDLKQERRISPLPPNVIAGAMIVPIGLIEKMAGSSPKPDLQAKETKRIETIALETVMETERKLGFDPRDVSAKKCGYDAESRDPKGDARLRFIEVKGRIHGADSVTITKNEILTALNKPEQFILAVVEVDGEKAAKPTYIRQPFGREPDFGVTSVNYKLSDLLAKGEPPR